LIETQTPSETISAQNVETDAPVTPPVEVTPAEALPATAVVEESAPVEILVDETVADETNTSHDSESESDEVAEPENGFAALGLSEPILRAVAEMGYLTPTPIQEQAIPFVLMGRDVLGCAQTGTGKTAGFTLPMLDILQGSRARARMPRSLILEPTRELALQVAENFVKYGKYLKLTHALIIGGESMSDQKDLLNKGVDVLIATPGRLIDMFERGGMLLTQTSVLVIDEADRMLDMGFIPDVEKIVAMLPPNRQTLFFSATMAPEIKRLADAFLRNPKEISVSKPASVATTITSRLVMVAEHDKREALRRLIRSEEVQSALIFCNRKKDVDILFKSLQSHGFSVGALHGDMAQPVRFATLEKFKAGEIRLLCCSDVAARGIDIGGLSHVFNFDVPIHAEDYVHRIGRTGRAGKEGCTFMLATPDDRLATEAIEKLTGNKIELITIDGLDSVEWSEGRGKRGRGRPSGDKPERAEKPKRAEKPVKAEKIEKVEATEEKVPEKRAPRPERKSERAPRRPEPALVPTDAPQPEIHFEPRAERVIDTTPAPRFDRNAPFRSDRDRGRDRPRRDDDLGPSVVGFGDEIPAFMLVAARPKRHASHTAHAETQDAADTED
jgi:superfamily II DNA/RNA helicase